MKFDFRNSCFSDLNTRHDSFAIVGADVALTWSELLSASDQWVAEARRLGARRDVPIVIAGHKQASFVVAMTGCLRLGAPFVPVDTIYPEERLAKICAISGAELLFRADREEFEILGGGIEPLREQGLAYIMFTSGSTGEPKGVQIGLESIAELADWMNTGFQLGEHPVFMNQAPFSFDLSIYEIAGTLSSGGTCVLNSREIISDTAAFYERLHRYAIDTWISTPSFAYQQLIVEKFCQADLPTLRTFLFCGEILPNSLAKRLLQRFPDCRVINTYGPTEATVATTWITVDEKVIRDYDPLPVGYVKPDVRMYSDELTGELCIVGNNVMRGYINREDLNSAKMFIENGRRGFRTGDAGFINENGLVFCNGRMDDQIKLHGYRIELSEVDAALTRLPGVLNGATIPLRKADGTAIRLIAFVVPAARTSTEDMGISHWKSGLESFLPQYMIPSEILTCDALPMSANNKVDRKQLADIYLKRTKF